MTNRYDEVYLLNVDPESGILLRSETRINDMPYFVVEANRYILNEPVDPTLFQIKPTGSR